MELYDDFSPHQWCHDLITSPDIIDTTTGNRRPPPPADELLTCRLVSETLWTSTAIRAWRTLAAKHTVEPNIGPECYLLVSLGRGLDSYRDVMHGGMLSLLMDQLAGIASARAVGFGPKTAELTVSYKKSVVLPKVVLCRAAATRTEGNKTWVKGRIEDGEGTVYCEASILLIGEVKRAKSSL